MINFFTEDVSIPLFNQSSVTAWLCNVCESENKELDEVSIIFCSDDYLLTMNNEYLQHDYYTDIITFDYCVDNQVVGDLFVSVDRVTDNAKLNQVSFDNELLRVMVHGILHLIGFKDKSDEDSKLMRLKEDEYLNLYVPRET
ncbi:MAG: rRNA maturation RNase YbeY [Crocinitomicaceae bacterium]